MRLRRPRMFVTANGSPFLSGRIDQVPTRYCSYTGVILAPDAHEALAASLARLDGLYRWDVTDHRMISRRAEHAHDVIELLRATDFGAYAILVDKGQMSVAYAPGMSPTSDEIGLGYLMRQYAGWLRERGETGDLMAGARGRREDEAMRKAYRHRWSGGGRRPVVDAHEVFSSREVKLHRLDGPQMPGMRLVRLVAWTTIRYVSRTYRWAPARPISCDLEREMVRVLTRGKFLREYDPYRRSDSDKERPQDSRS